MTRDADAIDLTTTVEVIAVRLLQRGAPHPVSAALALAARGQDGTTVAEFADTHGLSVADLLAIEAGTVALEDLPDQIAEALDRRSRIDLLAMADLDTDIRRAQAARQAGT